MARNPVGWFELYVQDMPRARAFYEALFDVALQRLDGPDIEMWAFAMGDEQPGASGALVRASGMAPGVGGTVVYFSCEDCAVQAARAREHGGRVLREKFSIGPYGFVALVHDSEGNLIGLHSMQ